MKNRPLVYVQMPHESNLYHASVDVLQRMAKDKKGTFTLTINKTGRWVIKSGLLKAVNHNFISAVRSFAISIYPQQDND